MRSETFLLKLNKEINSGEAKEVPPGSNRGPRVDYYLKTAGSTPGNPWCAAFLYAMAMETGLYDKKDLPSHPASVYGWKTFFSSKGLVHADINKVKRGDIGFWLNEKNLGHIFAINEVKKIGPLWYVRTSEGNTNEEGNREGWLAAKKLRPITSKFRFISFHNY